MGEPEPEPPLVAVYLTNAVGTSDGHGPGVKRLPAPEAAWLVSRKVAVYGTEPPAGFHPGPW